LGENTKKGICGICSAGCWIIAEYDDRGRIVKLTPDEDSPMGITCKLAEHVEDIVYSENRLLNPMRRTGPKGTLEFEPITWDEAYEEIVSRLNIQKEKYGPEAAAIYTGVGTFELAQCDVFQPKDVHVSSASSVLFPYGSPNTMGVGALCYVSYGMIAPHVTMGRMLTSMFNEIDNSEMIVVWGTNPSTDLPPVEMTRILEARDRGADIVVIDPRRTETVKLAEGQWVPIRPGTDGALALGMCNVMIAEELYDDVFVRDWTHGFEDFSRYVQHFTPEVVEGITGVPAETQVSLARRLAEAKGASQLMYTGLEYSNSGVQAIRATLILWALAGQLDAPGGRCFTMPDSSFPINREGHVKNPDTGIRLGKDKFPVYVHYRDEAHAAALPKSVLEGDPYKVRSLIVQGASLITSWPDTELWRRTLSELDFLVCIDRQLTADAKYADIVLPAATYFEIDSYMVYGPMLKERKRMIEPLGEARPDMQIMAELAARLGYGELYPQNTQELLTHALKGSGFTYEQFLDSGGELSIDSSIMQYKKWEKGLLRSDGKPGFDTPTGKFEIASTVLEEFGYDALPVYTEPAEGPQASPELLGDYPLVFTSGSRSRWSFHTQQIANRAMIKARPGPEVTLNSIDAKERGIKHGDKVRISTPRGAEVMRVYVTEDIVRGTIDANHACGGALGPEAWTDTNVNALTDMEQADPISGFPIYKSLLCEVEKVGDADGVGNLEGEVALKVKSKSQPRREVYLDNNATTGLAPEVIEYMHEVERSYGNASSIHAAGRISRKIIDDSRRKLALSLNCTAKRVVFTGSGSESNNYVLKGLRSRNGNGRIHIITSSIEHPSVLGTCNWLEGATGPFSMDNEITYLPVDRTGMVNPDDLKKAMTKDTALVSIMLANNETGTIQPIKELAKIAHRGGALMHTDAVQGFGKIAFDVGELGIDMASLSAHKLNGPKGVGALYIARGVELEPLIHGGGQEHGMRAGTENITGIAGFGRASELIQGKLKHSGDMASLRDVLYKGLMEISPDIKLNGHETIRVSNTLNITLPGFRGESVVLALARYGVYLSSGSACKSGSSAPSEALMAMGLSEEDAHCSLRFSLGTDTTLDDINYVIESLKDVIERSRSMIHFVPCR
jgi:cysteine sulfinate desulfinase/cysteine desulfurase-like protein/anaerobic selenocysteine-containing dehydrogenase